MNQHMINQAWRTYANLASIAKNLPVEVRGSRYEAGAWNKQYRRKADRLVSRAYARFWRRKGIN